MSINKHYKEIKKAIRKTKLADWYFVSKYSFSPYMACEHACKYCDGRAEKYYVQGDYEKDIVIRKNLPEVLASELLKLREPGIISIGSGISDPYQPVEAKEELMLKCAGILAESNFSVSVLTKSSLILRDIEIWQKVHEKNGFILMFSLTTLDDKMRKIFEPNASSVDERLEALTAFKSLGIPVGVLAMPFLPYLTDTDENISNLLKKLFELDVDFVLPNGLTLRPGKQKQIFFETLKSHFPQLLHKYEELYSNNLQSGMPLFSYRKNLYPRMGKIISEYSIPMDIPHQIYKGKFALYDELYILLRHLKNLYFRKGVEINRLEKCVERYKNWLIEEKKFFNRRRKLHYIYLEEKLKGLIETGKIADIIQNKKLCDFIEKIVVKRTTFDYISLKLN